MPHPSVQDSGQGVVQRLRPQGLLLLTCGVYGNVVRMIPPLVVTSEQVDEGLALWTKALNNALS